jgi:hypothetical protein
MRKLTHRETEETIMRMRSAGGILFGVAAITVFAARAGMAGPCADAARLEFKGCKADCTEERQVAKDACLNRDHDCVEACRAGREDCREATGFDEAIDACNATRDSDVQNCKDTYPPHTVSRDNCIDDAQVKAFQCRDQAREDFRVALRACRKGFRACASACGPADVPVDASQCKRDAKNAYVQCRAECVEDRQVAIDACHNKDHDCVEDCREDREVCRAPIITQRDATITQCNADRDAAIDPPPPQCPTDPGPARDDCVDQAQVIAFECRDQAREDARPGLHQCRVDFRDCVQVCPAPS